MSRRTSFPFTKVKRGVGLSRRRSLRGTEIDKAARYSRVDTLFVSCNEHLRGHCQLSGPRASFSGPARLERGSKIGKKRSFPTRAAAPPTQAAYRGRLS